jgi:prepilin-type N-terminal cleavage/methylation domain-containing protein
MTCRQRHLGFTIVELMTVVVIAGLLLVLALPAFNDMLARRRLEGQANELVTDLGYAKSEAVQRNRSVEVRTGGGGTCYTVAVMTAGSPPVGNCNCAAAAGSRCTVAGTTELKTVTLMGEATIDDGRVFVFEPVRGALEPAVAASAAVRQGARSYTVDVTAYGRVTPFTQ